MKNGVILKRSEESCLKDEILRRFTPQDDTNLMNRIDQKFNELKKKKQKALILFMTAGDPSLKKNAELAWAFEKEGVDILELGVPFSDPLADGPVIQAASQRALENKTTLLKILSLVKQIRQKSQIPIVLMTYLNPIYKMGLKKFAKQARQSGVDGIIVPDLPVDESAEIEVELKKEKLQLIYLLAPTSSAQRRNKITQKSRGFIYYVSITGVTGQRKELAPEIKENIQLARRGTRTPICVGFGISSPKQAKTVSGFSDGVIVGSAIVRSLEQNPSLSARRFSEKFVRPFVEALNKKR